MYIKKPKALSILFLTRYSYLGASSRMRFLQFLPWLEQAGFECVVAPFIDDLQLQRNYQKGGYGVYGFLKIYLRRLWSLLKVREYDVVWIEKEALPWLPAWLEVWMLRGVPYVLDYDDAIFHNYDRHPSVLVRYFYGRRIDRLMASARLVVGGNAYLAQRARDAGARSVEIVPTVIDLDRYTPKIDYVAPPGEPLRIVWIGSPSTMGFLELLREPLAVLSAEFMFKFRVIAGGDINLPGIDVEFVPWALETEVGSIQVCDLGVMPLTDSDWDRGKCGYKLIQYMACGVPVVASAVGANCEIVREGESGYLVDTHEDWVDALGKLLADASLRQKMGGAGRKRVESEYCIQKVAPKLVKLLSSATLSERR